MKTYEELIESAKGAIAAGDDESVSAILCEALGHLNDFSRSTETVWERDVVRSCCHEIGELIYDEGDVFKMQDIHRAVYAKMKGVAARYLEHFWDGCGDGDWRG